MVRHVQDNSLGTLKGRRERQKNRWVDNIKELTDMGLEIPLGQWKAEKVKRYYYCFNVIRGAPTAVKVKRLRFI